MTPGTDRAILSCFADRYREDEKLKQKTDTTKEISHLLMEEDDFLISAHIRADGDAVASVCFMLCVLRKLNKRCIAVLDDAAPDSRYEFLTGFDSIRSIQDTPLPFSPRIALLLDTPNATRLGRVSELLGSCHKIVTIDHHPRVNGFGGLELIDTSVSSTCELLAKLYEELPIPLDSEMAEALYTGILFDTGQFRFSNTGSRTLALASTMVAAGASPEKITERLFYRWSHLKAKTLGRIMTDMTLHENGTIAIMCLDHDFFRENPGGLHVLEGFSDLGISLASVKVSAFLKELEPGAFKVSLRATESYDVGRVSALFGGGGHSKASGCEIQGAYSEVVIRIVNALNELSGI